MVLVHFAAPKLAYVVCQLQLCFFAFVHISQETKYCHPDNRIFIFKNKPIFIPTIQSVQEYLVVFIKCCNNSIKFKVV